MESSSLQRLPLGYFDVNPYLPSSQPSFGSRETALKRKRSFENLHPPRPTIPRLPTISATSFLEMETYSGHVRTPADAIILFEACRLGLLPRVQRRLSEKERQSIKSGSVFVWDEREAGMRRWTDGKSWSASRVSGSFLTYREMEGKRGGNNFGPPLAAVSRAGRTPDSTRGSDSDLDMAGEDGPDGYRYKPDGLMKQSFSITTSSGNHLHLISYYSRAHPSASGLTSPTSDPQLRHIRPQKGMYPESTVHEHQNIPAVTRSPMVSAPYSTVPQMAGYARQGPPQWAPHHNGYGWGPPPPMQNGPYGYQYLAGPPPPTNGHSLLSHSQSAHQQPPTSQSYSSQYHAYDQRRFPPMPEPMDPNLSAYDQRNRPPPTPQQQHQLQVHQQQQDQHQHQQHLQYGQNYRGTPDPNLYYDPRHPANEHRNPAASPDSLAPPPPHHSRSSSSENGGQHPPSNHSHPSPHMPQPSLNGQQQHTQEPTVSSTPIDPRLTGSSAMMPQAIQASNNSRTPTPAAPAQENSENTPTTGNGTSPASTMPASTMPASTIPASTMPSIGAIMNGAAADNSNSPNADARSDRSREGSPGGSVKKESGPQDIPSDKLGFGEDMRALKVLDRAFKT